MDFYLTQYQFPYLHTLSHILQKPLLFVDLEATGLVHEANFSIIEIGLVIITPDNVFERSSLVRPLSPIPPYISSLTGITNEMVQNQKPFEAFNSFFQKKSYSHVFCGFNSRAYDSQGIIKMSKKSNLYYSFDNQIDIRYLFLQNRNNLLNIKSQKGTLLEACEFYKIQLHTGKAHRAAYDIALTTILAEKMLSIHGISSLQKEIKKFSCQKTQKEYQIYLSRISTKKEE